MHLTKKVTISGLVAFSNEWTDPANDFSRIVAFSPESGGCVLLMDPRLDPCGPLDWQSVALPQRADANFDLSFLLTPRGGTFSSGKIVLSSTPVPSPTSTLLTIIMNENGDFAAINASDTTAETTYLFTPGTTLRAELTTDPTTGSYTFNVGRFNANQTIADGYTFGPEWDGSIPAYLCYRTFSDGCIEIASLVEGETCGPEDWSAIALQETINEEGRVEVQLTPLGNNFRDGVWGLTHVANPIDFRDLGPIIQFGTDNLIRVRDGEEYRADTELVYEYGNTYDLTLIANPLTRRYSVFFEEDGDQVTLATNYAFRADWTGSNSLAFSGSRTVIAGCLMAVSDQLVSSRQAFPANIRYDFRHFGQDSFGFVDASPPGDYIVKLYDLTGKLIATEKAGGSRFRFPLPTTRGVYLMMTIAEDRSWASRLKFAAF